MVATHSITHYFDLKKKHFNSGTNLIPQGEQAHAQQEGCNFVPVCENQTWLQPLQLPSLNPVVIAMAAIKFARIKLDLRESNLIATITTSLIESCSNCNGCNQVCENQT